MALAAFFVGLLIVVEGLVGIVAPDAFVKMVGVFQTPNMIYLAAAIRVAFGIVLVLATPASRSPRALRVLGILITVGGVVSPFIGTRFASLVFGWWSNGGPNMVRLWAGAALLLGGFIIHAVARRGPAA